MVVLEGLVVLLLPLKWGFGFALVVRGWVVDGGNGGGGGKGVRQEKQASSTDSECVSWLFLSSSSSSSTGLMAPSMSVSTSP